MKTKIRPEDIDLEAMLDDWPRIASVENAAKIRKAALHAFWKDGTIATMYPTMGLYEALWESGFPPRRPLFGKFFLWTVHRKAKQLGDRPGVNDYLMAKWLITRHPKYIAQIVERSRRDDPVGWSCRWMVASVSQRNPEFAAAVDCIQLNPIPTWPDAKP